MIYLICNAEHPRVTWALPVKLTTKLFLTNCHEPSVSNFTHLSMGLFQITDWATQQINSLGTAQKRHRCSRKCTMAISGNLKDEDKLRFHEAKLLCEREEEDIWYHAKSARSTGCNINIRKGNKPFLLERNYYTIDFSQKQNSGEFPMSIKSCIFKTQAWTCCT